MKFSFPAVFVGVGMLGVSLFQAVTGHPPFSFLEAYLLAALFVVLGAMGGFEWGFCCLALQALVALFFRDAVFSSYVLLIVSSVWYIGVILLAVHGSRVLMGIAAGVLFVGLLLERIPTFSFPQWLLFFALFFLEVSTMYLASNVMRGRWFSPYA